MLTTHSSIYFLNKINPLIKVYMILFFLIISSLHCQSQSSKIPSEANLTDTLISPKINFLRSTGLVLGSNTGIWAYNRFVDKIGYAYINWNTIKTNFENGFMWDNDMFGTNFLGHPIQGYTYYHAARSNGMNFWASTAATATGSLLWEYFMENEPPAYNDFASTTLGGAALGEVLYRLSDKIIDDRTGGFNRLSREVMIVLVAPFRGLNRMITGQAWQLRNIKGNSIPNENISVAFAAGYKNLSEKNNNQHKSKNVVCYDLDILYGDPFVDVTKPYDSFAFRCGGNLFSDLLWLDHINLTGTILNKNIALNNANNDLTMGIYQYFNYYESLLSDNHSPFFQYKISEAASFGPGIIYKFNAGKKSEIQCSAFLGGIIMGGEKTDYYVSSFRNYNMGSGFSSKLNFDFTYGSQISLLLKAENYNLYTWIGQRPDEKDNISFEYQGDFCTSNLTVASAKFTYVIGKHYLVSAESGMYYRKNNYKYYQTVTNLITENKLSVGFVF